MILSWVHLLLFLKYIQSDCRAVAAQHALFSAEMHAAVCTDGWNTVRMYAEESYFMDWETRLCPVCGYQHYYLQWLLLHTGDNTHVLTLFMETLHLNILYMVQKNEAYLEQSVRFRDVDVVIMILLCGYHEDVFLTALSPLSQDTNLRGRFGRTFLIQRSCVPLSLVYRAASVPGCPQDVNPQLYYPVAHCCSCRRCDTRTHHCVRSSRISYDGCTVTHGSVKSQDQPALETWQNANTSGAHAWKTRQLLDVMDQQCFRLLMLL